MWKPAGSKLAGDIETWKSQEWKQQVKEKAWALGVHEN